MYDMYVSNCFVKYGVGNFICSKINKINGYGILFILWYYVVYVLLYVI